MILKYAKWVNALIFSCMISSTWLQGCLENGDDFNCFFWTYLIFLFSPLCTFTSRVSKRLGWGQPIWSLKVWPIFPSNVGLDTEHVVLKLNLIEWFGRALTWVAKMILTEFFFSQTQPYSLDSVHWFELTRTRQIELSFWTMLLSLVGHGLG